MKAEMIMTTEVSYPDQERAWLFFMPDDGTENEVINLYPQIREQELEGFGGAVTDAAGYVFSQMSEAQREEMLDAYFGENGMHYNRVRLHMDSCDFSTRLYSADPDASDEELEHFSFAETERYMIPLLEAAQKRAGKNLNLMLSAWSPPEYMKTNGSRLGGGSLKKEYYGRWAAYICRYIEEFQKRGFQVERISIQNEPAAVQTWDSCVYTPEEEKEFLKDHLYPELQKRGLDQVEVFAWDHNKERLFERAEMLLDLVRKHHPAKKLILSESCLEFGKYDKGLETENAVRLAHDMIGNLNHGMCAFYDWNLLLDAQGGPNHQNNYCDASLFHDDDGRKYVVALEWETREGYEKPGAICMVEYDPEKQEILGYPRRIWSGGTDRGCIEAPHLTKKDGRYYIMCAEGGTGYNHCVTMGRSDKVWGPYEKDPENPILTSVPGASYERHDPDHLKPKYYNPESVLQKSGHGSYVEMPDGEVYLVHLTARPFVPELRCTLGRETAIQKMEWTKDGWLRLEGGGNLVKLMVPDSRLPEYPMPGIPEYDDFDSPELGNWYYAPRIMPQRFADVKTRPGYVRIRGQESRTSLNKVSILARKLTSVYARVTTKMEFTPEVHQHSAGLILYYDNMNYINLRKYYSETLGGSALSIIHLENGEKTEFLNTRIPVEEGPIWLRLWIQGRKSWFEWSYDGEKYTKIGRVFDTTRFSDEYCQYGEFTGTMVGLTCADRVKHQHYADFDFFEYIADEKKPVE